MSTALSHNPRSRVESQVANLAFQCRVAVSPFTEEEEKQFFELLAIELGDLRTGSAQQKFLQKHIGSDVLTA